MHELLQQIYIKDLFKQGTENKVDRVPELKCNKKKDEKAHRIEI